MRTVLATVMMLVCACTAEVSDGSGVGEVSSALSNEELPLSDRPESSFPETTPVSALRPGPGLVSLEEQRVDDLRLPTLECVEVDDACDTEKPEPGELPNAEAFSIERPCPTCVVCGTCSLSKVTKKLTIKVNPSLFGAYVSQVKSPRLLVNNQIVWSSPSYLVAGPTYTGQVASLPSPIVSSKIKFDVVTTGGLKQSVELVATQ